MSPTVRNCLFASALLTVLAFIRSPWQREITQQETTARLTLPQGVASESPAIPASRFTFVALGGLRSLIASYLALGSQRDFSEANWPALEERFNIITALSPNNLYYWDTGAWHLARNSAQDYLSRTPGPPSAKLLASQNQIRKAQLFLARGIIANPDSWKAYALLSRLQQDFPKVFPQPVPDFARPFFPFPDNALNAISNAQVAVDLGAPQTTLYNLTLLLASTARTLPDPKLRHNFYSRSYSFAKQLYSQPEFQFPTLAALIFSLQKILATPPSQAIPTSKLFPHPSSPATQSFLRSHLRQNSLHGVPTTGIAALITPPN